MVINEEEKNAFTQSVMGDTEGGGGGSSVSICEANLDFNTGRLELLEKASVLFEQKKSGSLIGHFIMNISDTAYQESYFDLFVCTHASNATVNTYGFFVNMGDAGMVKLSASSGDAHPVGHIDLG